MSMLGIPLSHFTRYVYFCKYNGINIQVMRQGIALKELRKCQNIYNFFSIAYHLSNSFQNYYQSYQACNVQVVRTQKSPACAGARTYIYSNKLLNAPFSNTHSKLSNI